MADSSPEAIEAQIARQRAALAHTLDELGTKLDVKSQVKDRVGPPQLAVGAAVLVTLVALTWWRRRR